MWALPLDVICDIWRVSFFSGEENGLEEGNGSVAGEVWEER